MPNRTNGGVRIQMKKSRQLKSRMYYYFWGAMTLFVLLGQIYVGTGYRIMAGSVLRLTEGFAALLEYEVK